jgi:hypothetical protein
MLQMILGIRRLDDWLRGFPQNLDGVLETGLRGIAV